jgi:hypothetical protein
MPTCSKYYFPGSATSFAEILYTGEFQFSSSTGKAAPPPLEMLQIKQIQQIAKISVFAKNSRDPREIALLYSRLASAKATSNPCRKGFEWSWLLLRNPDRR